MPKTAVLIPAYKRPEYTELCLKSVFREMHPVDRFYLVDDGGNEEVIKRYARTEDTVVVNERNVGLRNIIIGFFEWALDGDFDYITKVDNDCVVPVNWLNDLTTILKKSGADILSPNTSETNAAYKYGMVHKREGDFIPSRIVGGLWFMKRSMIEDIYFEKFGSTGIRAAFEIIRQIVTIKSPKIGWTDFITYQDVGYSTGSHPQHIKSIDHAIYSMEIGRRITWRPESEHANVPN